MSEDVSTPVPDEPRQDPDNPGDETVEGGLGLSTSPHSGYEDEMEGAGVLEVPAEDLFPLDEDEEPEA
ncbi:hypothetical protein [Cellulomonas bogoriensis]|uniref:Uncharacterized protein n=1 Tax=Cellulomonas bogoriensis 69B4 = DSM 16987 TaxID=1386082 RepID=A0A0A0C3I7_9CELL|nr:hypothetical protein [Cellulomonas bogoriensis]KGM13944.1 hypothetical protein N869_07815 [Cellulomonas bogoriensis 69B4 = DSM 16987]